jgi:hypothetical protein
MRPIFKITDWDGLPHDPWYGLKDNPCWPSDLAPDDPGWALLTDDPFYLQQHPELAHHTESYRSAPDLQSIQDALQKYGGKPPWLAKGKNKRPSWWKVGDGEGEIPQGFLGVLPGIPSRWTRKMARGGSLNDTELLENSTDSSYDNRDEGQDDADEWDEMLESYSVLMDYYRYPETSFHTVAPRTDAQPTPQVGGIAPTVSAVVGPVVSYDGIEPTSIPL